MTPVGGWAFCCVNHLHDVGQTIREIQERYKIVDSVLNTKALNSGDPGNNTLTRQTQFCGTEMVMFR
jgi:hypothetical protein